MDIQNIKTPMHPMVRTKTILWARPLSPDPRQHGLMLGQLHIVCLLDMSAFATDVRPQRPRSRLHMRISDLQALQ